MAKLEIQGDWVVASGNDIRFYHLSFCNSSVPSTSVRKDGGFKSLPTNNSEVHARLSYIYSEMPYNRCIEWHPTLKGIICLWYAGKVIIGEVVGLDFQKAVVGHSLHLRVLGELSKNFRSCNIVSFCPFQGNILMVGFEKARNDSGLAFYNVEKVLESRTHLHISTFLPNDHVDTPLTDSSVTIVNQFGSSQGVHSACWLAQPSNLLVVGMGFKWIRAYNLLEPGSGPVLTISTKSVLGLTADPFNTSRFASFSEDGFIRLWDSAVSISEPLLVINSEYRQNLIGISFASSKSGLFCAYGKESPSIRIWQVDQASSLVQSCPNVHASSRNHDNDELDSSYSSSVKLGISWTRIVKPKSDLHINSLQWLNHHSLLICAGKDQVFTYEIPSAPMCAWSPRGVLAVASETGIHEFDSRYSFVDGKRAEELRKPLIDDIAKSIYERAMRGYGFNSKLNAEIVCEDDQLQSAWKFLDCITGSSDSSTFEIDGKDYRSLGLCAIVKNMPSSNVCPLGSDLGFTMALFTSGYRDVGLSLCGWNFKDSFHEDIQKLEYNGEFERAAGLLFFHHADLGKTIECLNGSGDERLILIAAALAGGLGAKSFLWKSLCKNLSYQLRDSFLRLLFGLISCDGDWGMVLNETSLSLCDRMIIALKFLDDTKLMSYVAKWTETAERHGRIDGLLLTGLNGQGVDLLERYIDRTGDVQSPALVISIAHLTQKDHRCDSWIECFRDLLDSFSLFHVRAKFDIHRRKEGRYNDASITPPQVFVKCNFCNQAVSFGEKLKKTHPLSLSNGRQKATTCPSCMASLPRCSICMLQLGSTFDQSISNQSLHSLLQKPSADSVKHTAAHIDPPSLFENWFSWCQSCHHGGHASHLFEWFSLEKTCPVTNCSCTCQV